MKNIKQACFAITTYTHLYLASSHILTTEFIEYNSSCFSNCTSKQVVQVLLHVLSIEQFHSFWCAVRVTSLWHVSLTTAEEQESFSESFTPTEADDAEVFGAIIGVAVGLIFGLLVFLDVVSLPTYMAYLKYNLNMSDVNPYPKKSAKTETTPDLRQLNPEHGIANMLPAAVFNAPPLHARPTPRGVDSFAGKLSDHFRPRQHTKPAPNEAPPPPPNASKPKVSIGMFRMH